MKYSAIVIISALVLGGTANAQAQRRYKVTVDSVPRGAAIYLEDKEAGVQGTTPHAFNLARGSYNFILALEGYEDLTQTVSVTKPETISLTLKPRSEPAIFTLEPAAGSESAGAEVMINGKDVGKLPVSVSLQPGRYLIEVGKEGFKTWSQWVDVQYGEKRTIVVALSSDKPKGGNLLVATNVVGAEVFVDGRRVDTAPALVEGLAAGTHVVEARAPGHLTGRKEVTVEAGKTAKVSLELQPDPQTVAAQGGTLQVLASHSGVEVFVNGVSRGMAPLKVEGLAEGVHLVEGRKEGKTSAEEQVTVKKGELVTIKLTLREVPAQVRGGSIRVVSAAPKAEVFIDGQLVGKAPVQKDGLDPGPHFVTVRAPGYAELVQTVEVKAGETVEVKAALERTTSSAPATGEAGDKADETDKEAGAPGADAGQDGKAEDVLLGLASYSAHLVPPGHLTGDVSLGFPFILESRLTIGLLSGESFGVAAGVELGTYGAMTELGAHALFRLMQRGPFAVAALFAFGGGGGPSNRNTVHFNLGALASLRFAGRATVSARAFFNIYSDRHCPEEPEPGELGVCMAPPPGLTADEMRERFSGARFFLSSVLEIALHRRVNLFFIFEGAPFQGNRRAFTDAFASVMPESDPGVYGRVGLSFKL